MVSRNFTWFSAIIVMLIISQHQLVVSLSPSVQKIALFRFKLSLAISTTPTNCLYPHYGDFYGSPSHPKTMNWSMRSDHCTWEGVSCEKKTGNVIGLDLSCSQLEGAILPNSTLFQLSHLRFLNLYWNNLSLSNQFPQKSDFFAKGSTHLNLSRSNDDAKLEDEVFKSLLQNLTQLRVLNLAKVKIFSVLPMNLSTSLRVINLAGTGLYGILPQEVFHLPNLESLDLSFNRNLTVILPKVKWGSSGSLQHLYLRYINLYGGIPDSIAFLEPLATLGLGSCNLSGTIPRFLVNLSQLTALELSDNHLNGQIPIFLGNLTNLKYLLLSFNNLIGPFPSFFAYPRKLIEIEVSNNLLTGPLRLPPRLFDLPSLEVLDVEYNGFTGQLYEFDSSKSPLRYFSCSNNLLYGPIPHSFSQLLNLGHLDLSSNNFSDVLATLPPKLSYLDLSSCNMKEFPHFSKDSKIIHHLDLSNNHIDGEIPHWIGLMGMDFLGPITNDQIEADFIPWLGSNFYLNLSHNRLTGGIEQLPWKNIRYLDLHSNMLNGSLPSLICNSSSLEILNLYHNNISGVLPICPTYLTSLSVFDLRMNNIQGNIPSTLSNFRNLVSLKLHGNKLEGRIPSSFADLDKLETLDLRRNQIDDTFPLCLEALPNLQVLVLKSNKFHGVINKSSKIEHPFPRLRIIDLSCNEFSGPLPALYFKNFKAMMDGYVNEIKPSYMGTDYYSDSTALVIKGVEIELIRILTVFTTIDVSRNNFEGSIADYIGNLVSLRFLNLSHNYLTGHIPSSVGKLTMLESLDLSFNQLAGEIPPQLTSIYSLARLNLSCNQLRGHIPEEPQFNTFDNDSYVGNLALCGYPLSKECEHDIGNQKEEEEDEDNDYFFSGFTWEAVAIGYGCGVVPAFIIGNLMLLAGKPKWFSGIIARELGLKIRRMEIRINN